MSSPVAAKSDAEGFNASRGPVLHAELTQVFTQMRQLHAQALELIGEMDAEDVAQLAGYLSIEVFLVETQRVSRRQATSLVKQAKQCRQALTPTGHVQPAQLPLVRETLPEGVLDSEHVEVIGTVMAAVPASAPLEARELVESTLVEQARHAEPKTVQVAGKQLLERLDPDGAQPKEHELAEPVNRFRYHRTEAGRMKFTGDIEPEAAELLDAMLSPLAKPQPVSPTIPDDRSSGQRLGDAFCEIVHMAQDGDKLPDEGGERPNINVTVDYDKLAAGTGQALLELGDPLPASVVRRMACDCNIIPMVLNADSVPIDLGRSRRVVDKKLRRALIARDRCCAWPGCRRRARRCEAHHIVSWLDGGPTDLGNLVLLCRMHHRMIEHSEWVVRMNNGLPEFIPPAYLDPLQRPLRNTLSTIAA